MYAADLLGITYRTCTMRGTDVWYYDARLNGAEYDTIVLSGRELICTKGLQTTALEISIIVK